MFCENATVAAMIRAGRQYGTAQCTHDLQMRKMILHRTMEVDRRAECRTPERSVRDYRSITDVLAAWPQALRLRGISVYGSRVSSLLRCNMPGLISGPCVANCDIWLVIVSLARTVMRERMQAGASPVLE